MKDNHLYDATFVTDPLKAPELVQIVKNMTDSLRFTIPQVSVCTTSPTELSMVPESNVGELISKHAQEAIDNSTYYSEDSSLPQDD
jgi:hypothetical protein